MDLKITGLIGKKQTGNWCIMHEIWSWARINQQILFKTTGTYLVEKAIENGSQNEQLALISEISSRHHSSWNLELSHNQPILVGFELVNLSSLKVILAKITEVT